jgi:CRISPR-associated protein (TIGR02584 family)
MPRNGMKSTDPRNILVAVAGGSPAIVTETLWSLTKQKNVRVDEVRVLTTEKGKTAILNTLLSPEEGKFQSCMDELELKHQIAFNESTVHVFDNGMGGELKDIRTDGDNTLAANQICAFIRDWTTEPNTRLFCSVAGGRKTMSIYLTIAMMLYGRKDDWLFHVLVNPEDFESSKDFFHPYRSPRELPLRDRECKQIKTISTVDVRLDLAEVPFVKLRVLDTSQLFGAHQKYSEIVASVQEKLEFLAKAASSNVRIHPAQFNRARIPIEVGGKLCYLPTAQGFVYTLVAIDRRLKGREGGVEVDLILPRDLRRAYKVITGSDYTDMLKGSEFNFLVEWMKHLKAKDADGFKRFKNNIQVNASRANDALEAALFPKQFLIQNLNEDKARGKKSQGAMYTINLPGDAIHLPSW